MKAIVHSGAPGIDGVRVAEVPAPEPAEGELLVRVQYAGLNRHELYTALRRNGSEAPQVLGADAFGHIAAAGPGTSTFAIGDAVIVNPTTNWQQARDVPRHPAILGSASPGTFATHVVIPEANAFPVPGHLRPDEAGALGLAGVTAYRALFTLGGVQAGERVLITGIGGGVALLALDLALSAGAEVSVSSRSAEKRAYALERGAHSALPSTLFDATAIPQEFNLVLDSVGAASVPAALRALTPGGRLVSFGATTGADIDLSLRELFFRQHRIMGTSVGSGEEFAAMLDHVGRHKIRPVVDSIHPIDRAAEIFQRTADGDSTGKHVFDLNEETQ